MTDTPKDEMAWHTDEIQWKQSFFAIRVSPINHMHIMHIMQYVKVPPSRICFQSALPGTLDHLQCLLKLMLLNTRCHNSIARNDLGSRFNAGVGGWGCWGCWRLDPGKISIPKNSSGSNPMTALIFCWGKSDWWFHPLWKIWVSWDYYSK